MKPRRLLAGFFFIAVGALVVKGVSAPGRAAHLFMTRFPGVAHVLQLDLACLDGFPSVRCRFVSAPLDPDNRDGEQIRIATLYARSEDRARVRGLLLVDMGGPDHRFEHVNAVVSGIRKNVDFLYDVAVIDVRGVGLSGPLEPCRAEERAFEALDAAPTDRARAAIRRDFLVEGAECSREGTVRAHLSLRAMASDIDAVRAALGAEKVAIAGTSFGGALAIAYATHHKERVDALVIDSPLAYGRLDEEPPLGLHEATLRALDDASIADLARELPTRTAVFTDPQDLFLASVVTLAGTCLDWSECPFSPRPLPRLLDAIDRAVSRSDDAERDVREVARSLVAVIGQSPSTGGEAGRRLLRMVSEIDGGESPAPPVWGDWHATRSEYAAIQCAVEERWTLSNMRSPTDEELLRSPASRRFVRHALPCPRARPASPRFALAELDVPVVFFAGTHDWLTPIVQTRAYARAAGAPLVVVEGSGHGAMFANRCSIDLFERALVERVVPEGDVACRD